MRTPSTHTQVLIVWTVLCGAVVAGLAIVAATPLPEDCFECGMPGRLAESSMVVVLIVWAVVAFVVLSRSRPPSA